MVGNIFRDSKTGNNGLVWSESFDLLFEDSYQERVEKHEVAVVEELTQKGDFMSIKKNKNCEDSSRESWNDRDCDGMLVLVVG